ncbi:MAG: hypothetical protein LBE82_00810 [Chitinophagaceae bacterium]|nr:hypothetical protein [Chitinophagaceae bacterium]
MLFFTFSLHAQTNYRFKIIPIDSSNIFFEKISFTDTFSTKAEYVSYLYKLPEQLAAQGFISASVDSIHEDSSSAKAYLFLGQKYLWRNLYIPDSLWELLNDWGYQKTSFNNQPFDPKKVSAVYEKLLDYYAQNGHPFAKISLDSLQLNEGMVSAKLNVDKGFIYYIDSIRIMGNCKLSSYFLHRYLDIKEHELYNIDKLKTIDNRLRELPYVTQTKSWDITMTTGGAILNLYLAEKKSNQVDAIVGFLPANGDLGGKLLVTGEVHLNLKNAFSSGEALSVNWQQLQARSPRIDLSFQKPYLFHSPYGIDFAFDLYKRDSFFVNINAQMGVTYAISAHQSAKIYGLLTSSRLLNVDTAQIISTKQLPNQIDVSTANIGFQYMVNTTNYRFNPRRGNELNIYALAGNRKIHENTSITGIKDPDFNYSSLYDSLKLNSYQLKANVVAAHYFPVGKLSVFKTGINAGAFSAPGAFVNELFQIGGLKTLRGFDEESIYANNYGIGTLEYRILAGQNSFFSAFSDIGWAQYNSNNVKFSHSYIGLGIGMTFETKTGIFTLNWAIGKSDDTNFNFGQSKIHLGFVTVF